LYPKYVFSLTISWITFVLVATWHHSYMVQLLFKGPLWSLLYGSRVYNYLCNQCLLPLKLWVRTPFMARCTRYTIMWYSLSVTCDSSVVLSLVFYVVFCRSLFVVLSCFFWPLYCLSFFDLRLLITTIFWPLYLYRLRLLFTTIFWPLYLYGLRLLITTIFWPLFLYGLRLLITTIFWSFYLYGLRLLITIYW
jgi:hypothetical protein